MVAAQNFDRKQFKELVHYICSQRHTAPSTLGSVKLNKILWAADFEAYYERGQSITGARYVRQDFGPVPQQILPVLSELQKDGVLRVVEKQYYGRPKKEFTILSLNQGYTFTDEEKEIIDRAINFVCDEHTASSISLYSHDSVWKAARNGEEIPYYTVFSRAGNITDEDREWARMQLESVGQ